MPSNVIPYILVHGSWHGAWCWAKFADYLNRKSGAAVYPMNLRGHDGTPGPLQKARLRHFVHDLANEVASVIASTGVAPILVGHSLGGAVVQKYLEIREEEGLPLPSGVVLMASVPPSGVLRSTLRFGSRHLCALLAATLHWRLKHVVGSPKLAHEMLFDRHMPMTEVWRYYQQLQDESFLGFFDTMFFDRPRPHCIPQPLPPILVLGTDADRVFSRAEVKATATAYGVRARFFADIGHDMMLSAQWKDVADAVLEFAQALPVMRAGM